MITIPGYRVGALSDESSGCRIYRGCRESDNRPVLLKLLRDQHPSPETLAEFRREYEIACTLDLPGVVVAYSVEEHQGSWVMVLEDFGGEPLSGFLRSSEMSLRDGPLSHPMVAEFLVPAVQIADTLGRIHQRQIVHRNICPSSIVLNPATGQAKIGDFGIATGLSRESPTFRNPSVIEGTLAYMSPEQTGRMNRAIDYRTDLYSLGATLYEWLTGRPPFLAVDPLELVHCHIARIPAPPHDVNPAVPQTISDIVMRLLSKDADDRYQSAFGLRADLEECLRRWQTAGCIEPFPLAQRDLSDRFQMPQRLYGREREVEQLLAAFERVSRGSAEMMLVAGHAGIGKTALVQEIYRPITRQRGYFISGKFGQFGRNVPYAALIQAFRSLTRLLLTESEARVALWRERLLAALGQNGQMVIDVIPEMVLILGPQPTVPPLPPTEAQNRFSLVFGSFVRAFAGPEQPLVIFLDDLQWADSASLRLINLLMESSEQGYLFLVGAYRDNEVGPGHPLLVAVEEIKRVGATVNRISLGPLDPPCVTQFVADTLRNSPDRVGPLGELVLAKTAGNPFFVIEFLNGLHVEGLLAFDFQQGCWQWDVAQIRARDITDNVVELLVARMERLRPETRQALKLAACIGNRFDLRTVAAVSGKPATETAADLWDAVAGGLILPLSDAYRLCAAGVEGLAGSLTVEYRFAHDRIQQAAYSLIPEGERQTVHRQVGLLYLRNASPDEREFPIFEIVNQLNLSLEMIQGRAEREELAALNLKAGRKAKGSTAFAPALDYLRAGIGLLERDCWETQYGLALELHLEGAEAAYLGGDFEEMDRLVERVLDHARDTLDRVRACEVRIQAQTSQARAIDAVKTALPVLELLGVELPEYPGESDIASGLQEVQSLLAGKQVEELIDLPEMAEPDKLAAMRILSAIASPAHITNPQLFLLLTLRQVELSIRYGNAPASSAAYATYGLVQCGIVGDIETGYRFGQLALAVLERLDARPFRAMVVQLVAVFTRHWKEPLQTIAPSLIDAYQSGLETGDLNYAGYSAHQVCTHSYCIGEELASVESKMAAYDAALRRIKQETALQWNLSCHQAVLNLLGRSEDPCRLVGAAYDEQTMLPLLQQSGNRTGVFLTHFHTLILNYLFHAYPRALESAILAEEYLDGVAGLLHVPLFHFFDSLTRLAAYSELPASEQQLAMAKVASNQERMKGWAEQGPANYLHKYLLVEAERARVEGRWGDAREQYDRAISLARENGYLNEEALANELAGSFYLARGQGQIAQIYLREAHYGYQRWGATAKVEEFEIRCQQTLALGESPSADAHVQAKSPTASSPASAGTRATERRSSSVMELASVMKAAQAISGEIAFERLLVKLIGVVLESAGAQRGCLVLSREASSQAEDPRPEWVIEVQGAVDREAAAVLQSVPVTEQSLPMSIVNYVARTLENVVLDDAAHDGWSAGDSYIMAHQPLSVLCAPLVHKGELKGMLYLENNLTTGAFTPDRLEVLRVLSGQVVISLENARLYDQLEGRVRERTAELARANTLLRQEIAERERAEEQLVRAQRLEMAGRMAAQVAHDFNNLLGPMMAYPELIKMDLHAGHPAISFCNAMLEAARRMADINEDMMTLGRRGLLEQAAVDLNQVVEEAVGQTPARPDTVVVKTDLASDLLPISGVAAQLFRVVINLLSNAREAMCDGGLITIGTENVYLDGSMGDYNRVPAGEYVRLTVADTGPGIPAEIRDRIFDPFFSTKRAAGSHGDGLGLAIVQAIVGDHRGYVDLENGRGDGTVFSVYLPVDREAQRTVLPHDVRGGTETVLVVDDDPMQLALVERLLEQLGYRVEAAASGEDAVARLKDHPADLLILDMVMPGGIDGVESYRRVLDLRPKQPALIMSGFAPTERVREVQAMGAGGYLRKPVTIEKLAMAVRQELDRTPNW